MEKQQTKQIRKYISWGLLVVMVALLAFLPMVAAGEETADGPQASILSASAQMRSISAPVMGGGTLTAEEAVEITVPAAVKLTEYLVANGDIVAEGQPVAAVDRVTVMTAITQVQETMEYLQEQIEDIRSEEAPDQVAATAGGTVKIIYAGVGESVPDVMLRDGALAVLSLDGLMAVQVERNTDLSGGDEVCVTLSDGTEVDGRVESNLDGILVVTIEDEGYAVGETVRVTSEDGDRIGSGTLYIHCPWNVVAYSGAVARIRVSEGDTVAAGKTLFDLKDTGLTAQFEALSRQHREYEELMLELFRMYQSESITAPSDGMVTGVDESGAFMLSHSGNSWSVTLLANAPNGDDESTYVNYVGQVTEVGIDGLILKLNPQPLTLTDYKDLSAVPMDTALMTEDAIYSAGAPMYELSGEEWVQLDAATITAGDILLFAGDEAGNFVWVVRVAAGTGTPEEPEPTEPTAPTEPADPADPTAPTESTTPTEPSGTGRPSQSGSGGSQGSGNMPNMGGGMTQEETAELYGLDTVTIASVTPQESMTIRITVDELDISKIYVDQSAAVTVEALTGEKFTGVVSGISASGENGGGNSKFTVEITLDKQSDMLAGMSASVALTTETQENVLCIPVAALIENGAETIVYCGYDEETGEFLDPVTVTVGASDGEYAEILSGIAAGQTVHYPYYDTLVISNVPDVGGGFPFG